MKMIKIKNYYPVNNADPKEQRIFVLDYGTEYREYYKGGEMHCEWSYAMRNINRRLWFLESYLFAFNNAD